MIGAAPAAACDVLVPTPLTSGWELASAVDPAAEPTGLRFVPAHAPGTVASVLRQHNGWHAGDGSRFDTSDHWFRCRFRAEPARAGEEIALQLGGIATIAEVRLNGEIILKSASMFAAHEVNVTSLVREENELVIVCRSLASALRERRGQRPWARWRTRVVLDPQLRWFRTTLLGRAPGFAAEPEPVGPWRPVTLLRRRRLVVEHWWRTAGLDGSCGVISTRLRVRCLDEAAQPVSGRLIVGSASAPLEWEESDQRYQVRGALRIPNAALWWPHTHGSPAVYPVRVELELSDGATAEFEDVPLGFRVIDPGASPAGDAGLALCVNGVPVFCRGIVWTPPDIVSLAASPDELRRRLQLVRDAGFNLIRVAGTTVYESDAFHRLCDELGLLVWQDMMFANMDYPFEDPGFHETARAEAECELRRLARHASSAVICGNSEIEQQAAMLGLDAALGRGRFFGEEMPTLAARHCPGVPYIPSAPCGGDLPFRTRSGVANYFGVGAYLRPIEDARCARVRFASECLAFSNVPEPEALERMAVAHRGGLSPTSPAWKRGVPRDAGAGWDFEDVRDHYLKLLYSVDPVALRYADAARYWDLSRMVSGEAMAEVFGEWRRPESGCGGGILLWCGDLEPGAGWGILESDGLPKAAWWFLKRALAPCAVWMTDEGLNGVDIHVANDGPTRLDAHLRVALYRHGEEIVASSERAIEAAPHASLTFGAEMVLGRFLDASYAYRFGPAGHDLIAASLRAVTEEIPFAQSFRFPAGHPTQREPISRFGFTSRTRVRADGAIEAAVSARRFLWGVRLAAAGFLADDAYFGLEPGVPRRIVLTPTRAMDRPPTLAMTALNADGRLPVPVGEGA